MTQRSSFVLHLRPDTIDEYVEEHRDVWPELLSALRAAGIRNYTIFRAGDSVFGYFEAEDLRIAASYMEAQDVNTRWRAKMAPLFAEPVAPDGPEPLQEIFRLD
jgi:L-rhamnose mutarotase